MSQPRRQVRPPARQRHRILAGALALATCLFIILPPQTGRSTSTVDLVLILALDVSGSVNDQEFDLQKTGLARAFRHPAIIEAIRQGRSKRIAVSVVQWSGYREQTISIPWTVIADPIAATHFADRLATMPRAYSFPLGVTNIAAVIRYATRIALAAPYAADRRVVDISGDGKSNVLEPPEKARDQAIRAGMTVNGLAILNETPDLTEYYRSHVIGGPGAFVIKANDYDDYARAILRKLIREIAHHFIT